MIELIGSFGVMLWPMLVLLVLVLVLIVVTTVRLGLGRAGDQERSNINAILFWGVVTAILGLIGLWLGLYRTAHVIIVDGPRLGICPEGIGIDFAEALRPSILGLSVLLVASVSWFLLGAWSRRIAHR